MKILIFGVGGAGRAIYRAFKNSHEIVGFLENNTKLCGTFFDNKPIFKVEDLKNLDFDKIALGGVWLNDMKNQLLSLGILEEKLYIVDDDLFVYSDKTREEITNLFLKEFSKLMKNSGISYFVDGSSLLVLLRNQDLSNAQDIDIMVKSQDDLKKIYKLMQENSFFKNQDISKVEYKEDTLISKKGELLKIVIKSSSNPSQSEPVILDISAVVDIKDYYLLNYANDYYLYYNKSYIDGEKYFDYKGISLQIPFKEDKFSELLYGKNWITPAKSWSYLDYGNILNHNECIDFLNKTKGKI